MAWPIAVWLGSFCLRWQAALEAELAETRTKLQENEVQSSRLQAEKLELTEVAWVLRSVLGWWVVVLSKLVKVGWNSDFGGKSCHR